MLIIFSLGCRSGFDYLPGVNGCFKVIIQKLNWDQATEACRSIANGSNLAAITNAAKQDSIKSYLKLKFEGKFKQKCQSCSAGINSKYWGV